MIRAGKLIQKTLGKTASFAEKITILNNVWEKELGGLHRFWILRGIKNRVIYVKATTSAASHELHMRKNEVVKRINKHFRGDWIKGIRIE